MADIPTQNNDTSQINIIQDNNLIIQDNSSIIQDNSLNFPFFYNEIESSNKDGAKDKDTLFYEKVKDKLTNITEAKNYRTLCEILEETNKSNIKSKEIQLEYWSKFFSYTQNGYSFTNIHVFTQNERNAIIKEAIMEDAINYTFCSILVNYFEECNKKTFIITLNDLALLFGFFNPNFKKNINQQYKLSYNIENDILKENLSNYPFLIPLKKTIQNSRKLEKSKKAPSLFTYSEIKDFYSHTPAIYKRKIDNMFEVMQKNGMFFVSSVYYGKFISNPTKLNKTNEYGDSDKIIQNDCTTYEKKLTTSQLEVYAEVINQTLKSLDCISVQEVFTKNKSKIFYETIDAKMLEKLNVEYIYKAYIISFSPERINVAKETLLNSVFENNANFIEQVTKNKNNRITNGKLLIPQQKTQQYIFDKLCNSLLKIPDVSSFNSNASWVFSSSCDRLVDLERMEGENQ